VDFFLVLDRLRGIIYEVMQGLPLGAGLNESRVAGKLYVVGPLGDRWQDVPIRALRILREARVVVSQDIEAARGLFDRADIRTLLLEIGDTETLQSILGALRAGDVAWLVTSPADLSGPARRLLGLLIERDIEPVSVPGPSNEIAGLAVSGLPTDSYTFLGTISGPLSERCSLLERVACEPRTIVCEVTAGHLPEVVHDVLACLGDRRVMLYGERGAWRGQASQVQAWPGKERLTLVIAGAGRDPVWTQERVRDEVQKLLAAGAAARDVAREVARRSGWPRRQVYQLAMSILKEK
jgi:16S rRNA (cytidine1402-2'-O)-methyltransferase